MIIINNENKILKVKPIEGLDDVEVTEYKNNTFIIKIEDEFYFIINRNFINRIFW